MARVLIAFEASGTVRRAFAAAGHETWSVDIRRSLDGSNHHIVGDARDYMNDGSWDLLMVAHPPCTRLCNSGVRWLSVPPPGKTLEQMRAELIEGAALFSDALNANVPRIAVENPVMHKYAKELITNYVPFAQSFQPWQFGHPEFKRTCLWLKNLPALIHTDVLTPPAAGTAEHKAWSKVHNASPGEDRGIERSAFFSGVANAMANQWGALLHCADEAPAQASFGF